MATALELAEKAVLKKFDRTLKRSAAIVEAALRAPDIDWTEKNPKIPPGMTKRDMRIAEHAMLPAKSAPLYLTEAFRTHELAVKLSAGAPAGAGDVIARAVLVVVAKPQYQRVALHENAIDVEVEEPR